MLPQQAHGLGGEGLISHITCFRGAFIYAFAWGKDQCAVDLHPAVFKIHFIPFHPHNFATAATCDKEKMGDKLPLEGFSLQRFQYFGNGFRLEVVGGFFATFGGLALAAALYGTSISFSA